jgi:acyl-CoA synthetase (AMP-forming)/AMP-acid ligase II
MTTSETPPNADAARHINVADRLARMAELMPTEVAVACPGHGDVAGRHSYATCTFEELDRDAMALAKGLVELGVTPGMRLVLLVKPGIEFVKLVFALLRSGATTILIDPGMGREHLVNGLASAEPQGFVAIPAAQVARLIYRRRFPQAKLNVTVWRRWFWGGETFKSVLKRGLRSNASLPQTRANDPAAIIFTSGSTGPPKGVLYTHEMFETQVAEIQREYDLQPGGADLACFALFGLFNSAMGITTVFPDMNFSRPASADPRKLVDAANDWQVTQAFASPAVWDKLSRHCEEQGEQIPTLRKIFSCGAPVPAAVLQRTLTCVDAYAEMHTPYGATESLPVATIAASEVLGETASETARGKGVCVGRKFDTIDWRIIRISDDPIAGIEDTEELAQGEIGELIVRGPQVSSAYVTGDAEKHNAIAKIADGNTVWHRMGDVGYFDGQQRFWYCGRKNHRVETAAGTLFTECVEALFNQHPKIRRSALVGVPQPLPDCACIVLEFIEPIAGEFPREHVKRLEYIDQIPEAYERFRNELEALQKSASLEFEFLWFEYENPFPVDVRHNSKINRELLADWATKKFHEQQGLLDLFAKGKRPKIRHYWP